MGGDIEGMGALATATLAAQALDGRDGKAGDAHRICANCETETIGPFCHACGQASHVHRSMGHVVEEFLHGVWHFDSKAWRTLPLLAFKPGKLTREYIEGKRARYIAPLALFLFSVFLMFFVFGLLGGRIIDANNAPVTPADRAAVMAEARTELADAEAGLANAERKLAEARAAGADAGDIGGLTGDVTAQRIARDLAKAAVERAEAQPVDGKANPDEKDRRWQDVVTKNARENPNMVNTGIKSLDDTIRRSLLNPDLALYKVQQKAYKLSFLLVPLSLPLLWLLFAFKRGVTMYDHTVFALYSLSFMSLLLVAVVLLEEAGAPLPVYATLAALAPPIHMFAQLKGGYSLGWFGAWWRTWALSFGAIIVLALYFTFIVVIGLID